MEERRPNPPALRPWLPWITSAIALLTYFLTLNPWVTLSSVPAMAKMLGWDRFPTINSPIFYLISRPVASASAEMQTIILNGIAGFLGALSVWFLTRSVLLLPHDRTKEQRTRERGSLNLLSVPSFWLPPLVAGLALAFELTYWEHATAQTGETLDLLFFSLSIYWLLDFRLSKNQNQLYKLALVYGVGVTNNWSLIAFFPLFLLALIWIKGRGFFSFSFVAKMGLLGLVGLTPYLILPFVASQDTTLGSSFWELMRQQLGSAKNALVQFPRTSILLLSLTSILPIVFIGIRWPSSFGDTSAAGTSTTNWMFRLLHGLFLGACGWVMFDPEFSPRQLGNGYAMLPLYYLTALGLGYFLGYFLLITSETRSKSAARSGIGGLAPVIRYLVMSGGLAIPIALFLLNREDLSLKNGPALKKYAESLYSSLPSTSSIVLSDNRFDLLLLEGVQVLKGKPQHHKLIETKLLEWRFYHRNLERHHGKNLPLLKNYERLSEPIDSALLVNYLVELSATNAVHYLHPTFGYFLEAGYLKPKESGYVFNLYGTNLFTPPALSETEIAALSKYWRSRTQEMENIISGVRLKVSDLAVLGAWYSRTLNHLGVELQKSGSLNEAGQWFDLASRLNPENVAALINKQYNANRVSLSAAGTNVNVPNYGAVIQELIKRYATWSDLLAMSGPIDEPTFCFDLGTQFLQGANYHQAAAEFLRVQSWEPSNLLNQMSLAKAYHLGYAPDHALKILAIIDKNPASANLQDDQAIELARIRALALFAKNDRIGAETTLKASLDKFPRNPRILDAIFDLQYHLQQWAEAASTAEKILQLDPTNMDALFKRIGSLMQLRNFDGALTGIEKILNVDPNNELALLNQGAIFIHFKRYTEALKPIERILERNREHEAARLNRAIIHLQTSKWEEALKDYEILSKSNPNLHVTVYGIAESSFQLGKKERAHEMFEKYLKLAPEGTLEIQTAKERLQSLKKG